MEVRLKILTLITVRNCFIKETVNFDVFFNLLQILTNAQPILVMSMRRALTQTAPSSVLVVLVLMEMARFAKVRRRSLREGLPYSSVRGS